MLSTNSYIFKIILICTVCTTQVFGRDRVIIYKCCKIDEMLELINETITCSPIGGEVPLENITVYDTSLTNMNKMCQDIFDIIFFDHNLNETSTVTDDQIMSYLLETGGSAHKVEYNNSFPRWYYFEAGDCCIDNRQIRDFEDYGFITYQCLNSKLPGGNNDNNIRILVNSAGLLISSFFLALVIVVYAMCPELRTLGGKVAMTCAASLLGAFTFQGSFNFVLYYSTLNQRGCVGFMTVVYFFFLATFFWMNVMSYDLWWTFRGISKQRKINRRGETFKYRMYSIYGWGMPLSLTIFMVVMNEYPPEGAISPSIGVIVCYIGDLEQGIYLYAPMLILIICNCVLFLMTVYNIWRSNKSVGILRSQCSALSKNPRNMFFIFLKISVVMGISFILEIVSSFTPNMKFWYITDAYNILTGVAFFVIFICNKRALRLLQKKFSGQNQSTFSTVSSSQAKRKVNIDS